MNKVKYTEWIDTYVDGEMDETARMNFEAELASNHDLALEYNLEQDLRSALSQEDIIDLRAKCIEAQNEVRLSEKKVVKIVHITRKYWYAVASIMLIALIVGGAFLINPGGYSPEKLFRMYYESGETIGLSRSGNVDMAEALRYFSKNDYQTAEMLFLEILATDPNNFAVVYYSGISNIELKNYPEAIRKFESIINHADNLYIENSVWYLGLSYLAAGRISEAEIVFSRIASTPGHYYYDKSVSILEKIKKNEENNKILKNLLFLILPF